MLRPLSFFFILCRLLSVLSALQTITIDDQQSEGLVRPQYGGSWNAGPKCSGCSLQPSVSAAYGGTWMDATHYPGGAPITMEIQFTGVSIDLFCILPTQPKKGVTTNYNLSFILDRNPGQPFTHSADSTPDFTYNVPVFSAQGLENMPHSLVMSVEDKSTVLFDYALYKYDDSISSPSAMPTGISQSTGNSSEEPRPRTTPNAAVIALAIIVPLLVISLALLVFLYWRKRKQDRAYKVPFPSTSEAPSPDSDPKGIRQWVSQVTYNLTSHPPTIHSTPRSNTGQSVPILTPAQSRRTPNDVVDSPRGHASRFLIHNPDPSVVASSRSGSTRR
jgi:hypothetical protein